MQGTGTVAPQTSPVSVFVPPGGTVLLSVAITAPSGLVSEIDVGAADALLLLSDYGT